MSESDPGKVSVIVPARNEEANIERVLRSLAGQRGIVRITPGAKVERVVSGYGIVGLAFARQQLLIVATNNSLIQLPVGIEGKPLIQ